jgi:hypothetical protein
VPATTAPDALSTAMATPTTNLVRPIPATFGKNRAGPAIPPVTD